jgi:hypothetical protein
VGVQEVRWDKGGTARAGDCTFSMEKGIRIINCEQDFFVHQRIVPAVKTAEFVSDGISCRVERSLV